MDQQVAEVVHVGKRIERRAPTLALIQQAQLGQRARAEGREHHEAVGRQRAVPRCKHAGNVGAGVQHHVGPQHVGARRVDAALQQHRLGVRAPAPLRPPRRQLREALGAQRLVRLHRRALRLRIRGAHRGGAATEMCPPVEPALRRLADDRQALGHAARHLGMQPWRLRGMRQARPHALRRLLVKLGVRRDLHIACGHGGQYIDPVAFTASVGAGLRALVHALPSVCVICRGWYAQGLCDACLQRFAPRQPRCACCARLTAVDVPRCGQCLGQASAFRHCIAGADYVAPWDRLITAFKFHQQVELAGALSQAIERAVLASALQAEPASLARVADTGAVVARTTARARLQPGVGTGTPARPPVAHPRHSWRLAPQPRHRASDRHDAPAARAQPARCVLGRPGGARRAAGACPSR